MISGKVGEDSIQGLALRLLRRLGPVRLRLGRGRSTGLDHGVSFLGLSGFEGGQAIIEIDECGVDDRGQAVVVEAQQAVRAFVNQIA